MSAAEFPLVWQSKRLPPGRKGHACRTVPHTDPRYRRSPAGYVHVEFRDGQRFIVDGRWLAKAGTT